MTKNEIATKLVTMLSQDELIRAAIIGIKTTIKISRGPNRVADDLHRALRYYQEEITFDPEPIFRLFA